MEIKEKQKQKQKKKIFFFFKNKNNLLSKKLTTKRIKYDIFVDATTLDFSVIHDKKKNILILNGESHPSEFFKLKKNIYKYIDVSNIKKISSGFKFNLILTKDNNLYSFGNNKYGQCGVDPILYPIVNYPTKINIPKEFGKIRDIYCIYAESYILLENNNIYIFGRYDHIPTKINLGNKFDKTDKIDKFINGPMVSSLFFITKKKKIYDFYEDTLTEILKDFDKKNFKNIFYSNLLNSILILFKKNIIYEMSFKCPQKLIKHNISPIIKGKIIKIVSNHYVSLYLTTKSIYIYNEDKVTNEIEFFRNKNIINIVIKSMECIALSNDGKVYEIDFNNKINNKINIIYSS